MEEISNSHQLVLCLLDKIRSSLLQRSLFILRYPTQSWVKQPDNSRDLLIQQWSNLHNSSIRERIFSI